MEVQRPTEMVDQAVKNPHAYLLSIPVNDTRWEKVREFWDLSRFDINQIPITRLRKQRSKQVLIAIMNDRYCKGNSEIRVNHQGRVITFRYRDTVIGQFHQKIMTFLPVHAGPYEGSYATIGQRRSTKFAIQELVQSLLGSSVADRISLAYREFLMQLFGSVPRQPSESWVSRDAYVHAMIVIEEKYKLEVGDEDFLEWRLTLLGRSPKVIDDMTRERE